MGIIVLGAILMENRVSDGLMAAVLIVLLLIGFALLMGVQVARQWEKGAA